MGAHTALHAPIHSPPCPAPPCRLQKLAAERVQIKAQMAAKASRCQPPTAHYSAHMQHGLSDTPYHVHRASHSGAAYSGGGMAAPGGGWAGADPWVMPLEDEDVLERVARTIRREQSLHLLLRAFLFGLTLTPRQLAMVSACMHGGATACIEREGNEDRSFAALRRTAVAAALLQDIPQREGPV